MKQRSKVPGVVLLMASLLVASPSTTPARNAVDAAAMAVLAAQAAQTGTQPPSVPQADDTGTMHAVPLFPAASDPLGRQGFARVINRSGAGGVVQIDAYDDEGTHRGPLSLDIAANQTVHFNSDDLEMGNPAKGLTTGTGAGEGDWRLRLSSTLDIEVLSYIRTGDGFLTSMHDVAPETSDGHEVVTFNPGRNVNQVSKLRLVNPGGQRAEVEIEGIDDWGRSPGGVVRVSVEPGASHEVTVGELESGSGEGLSGALGTGTGKWRLVVRSGQSIDVMSLLSSPTGHLTNLSTTRRAAGGERPSGCEDPPPEIETFGHIIHCMEHTEPGTVTEVADRYRRQGYVRMDETELWDRFDLPPLTRDGSFEVLVHSSFDNILTGGQWNGRMVVISRLDERTVFVVSFEVEFGF